MGKSVKKKKLLSLLLAISIVSGCLFKSVTGQNPTVASGETDIGINAATSLKTMETTDMGVKENRSIFPLLKEEFEKSKISENMIFTSPAGNCLFYISTNEQWEAKTATGSSVVTDGKIGSSYHNFYLISKSLLTGEETVQASYAANVTKSNPSPLLSYQNEDKLYFMCLQNVVNREDTYSYYSYLLYSYDMKDGSCETLGKFADVKGRPYKAVEFCITGDGRVIFSTETHFSIYQRNGIHQNTYEKKSIHGFLDYDDKSEKLMYLYEWLGHPYWEGDGVWLSDFPSSGELAEGGKIMETTYHKKAKGICQVEFLEKKYLSVLHTDTDYALVYLIDPSKIRTADLTKSSKGEMSVLGWEEGENVVKADDLLVSHPEECCEMVFEVRYIEDSDYENKGDLGTRCVYLSAKDAVYVNAEERKIREISMKTKEYVSSFETSHPVYKMLPCGQQLVVLEREEDGYFIEVIDTENYAKSVELTGPDQLKIGDCVQYVLKYDSDIVYESEFESSDPTVLTIGNDGCAEAWKKGTAVVTAKSKSGALQEQMRVTVEERNGMINSCAVELAGTVLKSNTDILKNTKFSSTVKTYLEELSDGRLMRVAYVSKEKCVLVEYYSETGEYQSFQKIPQQLEVFGGFFKGKDAYYLVFGQANPEEDRNLEVVRVVKYDLNWNQTEVCSISNIGMYSPFVAGSVRMAEDGQYLYIHTCKLMYADGEGLHHQSNISFIIEKESMNLVDYSKMNISGSGTYVSHSLDEYVRTEGEWVYWVDHGDASPRGVKFARTSKHSPWFVPAYKPTLLKVPGADGENITGLSIGGFELSDTHGLIAGNNTGTGTEGVRNIFLLHSTLDGLKRGILYLTQYPADGTMQTYRPRLVKLTQRQFLMMWEEADTKTKETSCALVLIDRQGRQMSEIVRKKISLSECQPIVRKDSSVAWFVSDGEKTVLYNIDPFALQTIPENISNLAETPEPSGKQEETAESTQKPNATATPRPAKKTPAPGPKATSKPKTEEVDDDDERLYKGQTYTVHKIKYKVLKGARASEEEIGEVALVKYQGNKKDLKLEDYVVIKGTECRITHISAEAFQGNKTLKSLYLETPVKQIEKRTFANCKNLQWIWITSKKLQKISAEAFTSCKKLEDVVIDSKKLDFIGKKAFYNCKKLASIEVKTKKLTDSGLGSKLVKNTSKKLVILAPAAVRKTYRRLFRKRGNRYVQTARNKG